MFNLKYNHSTVQSCNLSNKKGFTIIEIVVVFLLMLGVIFLAYPKSVNSTRQAKLISKWSEKVSELDYMFSVIKAQKNGDIDEQFSKTQSEDERKKILLDTIKPYLRITSENNAPYEPVFMDKAPVTYGSKYYFDNFYLTSSDELVGLKFINSNCKAGEICFIMAFDVNGLTSPNTWGYDIYGINVFKDKIEPFGKDLNADVLKNNCSKLGNGVYCSYYYLMGGRFE